MDMTIYYSSGRCWTIRGGEAVAQLHKDRNSIGSATTITINNLDPSTGEQIDYVINMQNVEQIEYIHQSVLEQRSDTDGTT